MDDSFLETPTLASGIWHLDSLYGSGVKYAWILRSFSVLGVFFPSNSDEGEDAGLLFQVFDACCVSLGRGQTDGIGEERVVDPLTKRYGVELPAFFPPSYHPYLLNHVSKPLVMTPSSLISFGGKKPIFGAGLGLSPDKRK